MPEHQKPSYENSKCTTSPNKFWSKLCEIIKMKNSSLK